MNQTSHQSKVKLESQIRRGVRDLGKVHDLIIPL